MVSGKDKMLNNFGGSLTISRTNLTFSDKNANRQPHIFRITGYLVYIYAQEYGVSMIIEKLQWIVSLEAFCYQIRKPPLTWKMAAKTSSPPSPWDYSARISSTVKL